MRPYFPRHWHYGLVIMLATAAFAIQLSTPTPTLADHNSWRGRHVGITNYGSGATIGTSDPYVGSWASFEFIRTAADDGSMVQIGWSKQPACGPSPSVFWEHYTPNLGYRNACGEYFPTGDKDYYNEYDGNTGYWCLGYQGYCLHSEPASYLNFTAGSALTAYGETTHTSSSVQMGGPSQSQAVYISNIKYKPYSTAPPSAWNYVKTAGSSYLGCGEPNDCPYGYGYGFAATVLYTYNWTW